MTINDLAIEAAKGGGRVVYDPDKPLPAFLGVERTLSMEDFNRAIAAFKDIPMPDIITLMVNPDYVEMLEQVVREAKGFDAYILSILDNGEDA